MTDQVPEMIRTVRVGLALGAFDGETVARVQAVIEGHRLALQETYGLSWEETLQCAIGFDELVDALDTYGEWRSNPDPAWQHWAKRQSDLEASYLDDSR